jgi:hypothetical protein
VVSTVPTKAKLVWRQMHWNEPTTWIRGYRNILNKPDGWENKVACLEMDASF